MKRIRFDWRLAVRLLGALALVLVAFAHRAPVPVAANPDASAYAFPDGSIPVICITGTAGESPQDSAHALRCDACLISASLLVPQPADMAAPAFADALPELPFPSRVTLPRSVWPPSAPPTAPPLA